MEVVKIIRPQTGRKFVHEFSFVSPYHQDRKDLNNREQPKVCNNEGIHFKQHVTRRFLIF
jgi:hypothetical protein